MASFWPVLVVLPPLLLLLLQSLSLTIIFTTQFALADDNNNMKVSTISAAPAVLPGPPSYEASPALSPDIAPLFPSPAKEPLSPAESSLPTIPSSPSPPNPDAVVAPGPGAAFPPFSGSPISAASRGNAFGAATWMRLVVIAVCCAMWIGIGE